VETSFRAFMPIFGVAGTEPSIDVKGEATNTRHFVGTATYTYKICEATTNKCSNTATATFP
jgi:hypothetical protein